MPEIRFDLEVWCSQCGSGICHLVSSRRRPGEIEVDPCQTCAEAEYRRGYKEGYDNAA